MAFKNLLTQAPFLSKWGTWNSTKQIVSSPTRGYEVIQYTKTAGTNITDYIESGHNTPVLTNTPYTFSIYYYAPLNQALQRITLELDEWNGSTWVKDNTVSYTSFVFDSYTRVSKTITTGSTTNTVNARVRTTPSLTDNTVSSYIYLTQPQVEQNDHTTAWEFPGIDLTGNSIPSNTLINNVKLENIIRAFGIESQEQVNNLTLQNILTLTNIPSEEYVNNIGLLNEIILEGIESTTSVHDAVIYIKCNYMNVKFEMKYPSTSFKLKQPHTTFKMKYP